MSEPTIQAQYAAALVAAIGELSNVAKTASNPYFKSKYAPLDAIVDATRPVLAKHGLAIQQTPVYRDGLAGVVTIITHKAGHLEDSELLLPLKDQSPQGVGSAITYARRYALAAVLGLATEDDDDGNAGSGLGKQEAKRITIQNNIQSSEPDRPAIAKVMDKKQEAPRPAQAASSTWRNVEITDVRVAAKSKDGAAKKWVLYSVQFDGKAEALTFDEKLFTLAQELSLGKVDAGVAPGKKDPSKWELVSLAPTTGASANITSDEKA